MLSNLSDSGTGPIQWGVVIGASLVAACFDVRRRRIPNRLTISVWVAGLLWFACTHGVQGVGESLAGCLLMAAPYLVLFIFAGGGAGDAKLMGALGAWLGMVAGLVALGAVLLAGAVVALGYAAVRGRLVRVGGNVWRMVYLAGLRLMGVGDALEVRVHPGPVSRHDPDAFPYAVAVAVGVLAAAGAQTWSRLS